MSDKKETVVALGQCKSEKCSKKEERIVSLDKDNRLQVLQLANARHTRLILVVGLVALSGFAILLFFIYRNKEKLNTILNERNAQLALANDTKARLFGIISHDLRGPVSRIVQLLQIRKVRPEWLDEPARLQYEGRLTAASESVLETMEDLLLWSKSQMENFIPDFRPVKITDVLQKEITLLHQQLEDKDIRIDCRVPESFIRHTDENFLSVIVRNLLHNAIKYSDGEKTITVSSTGHTLLITNSSSTATAEGLNRRLLNRYIDSRSSGLGLQISADLAARICTRLFFREEPGTALTALLSWEEFALATATPQRSTI